MVKWFFMKEKEEEKGRGLKEPDFVC